MNYPQYRKYSNGKSYFKVVSDHQFEEIQVLGNRFSFHQFEAKILPDRNYIYDLLHNTNDHWLNSTEQEYERMKAKLSP